MRLGWRIYATKIRVVGVRAHDAALTDRSIVLVYIVGYTSQDRTLCAVLKGSAGLFVVDVGGDFDSLSVRKVRLIREVCRCACALTCTEEHHDDNIR